MRRIVSIVAIVGVVATLATVGSAPSAQAGEPATTLSLTKVVVGQEYAPAGAEWVIDASCIAMPAQTFALGDLGPRVFPVNTGMACTVSETNTGGAASVAYACDVTPPVGGIGSVVSCTVSDQGVTIEFQGGEVESAIEVTVTNTYTAPPTPANPDAPVPATGVVAAQPSFTG